jgi:hypothetical protein
MHTSIGPATPAESIVLLKPLLMRLHDNGPARYLPVYKHFSHKQEKRDESKKSG